jgi:hypothetical protein
LLALSRPAFLGMLRRSQGKDGLMRALEFCVRSLSGLAFIALAASAAAQPAPVNITPDATLRSTPETVVWGYITADVPAALQIKSGQTVKIDTVSHQGLLGKEDPAAFFATAGIPPSRCCRMRSTFTPRWRASKA